MDNGCSFIYLYTIIYQQFRTRFYTKYQVRRVLVNNADLQCPMAQSSLEGPLEDNCFLPPGLHKLGLHDWLNYWSLLWMLHYSFVWSEWRYLFEEYSVQQKPPGWRLTRLLTLWRLALVRPNLTLVSWNREMGCCRRWIIRPAGRKGSRGWISE